MAPPTPPQGYAPQPGSLWGFAYFALWLNLTTLAWMLHWPRASSMPLLTCFAWALALGIYAMWLNGARVVMHDMLVSLNPREQALIVAGTLVPLFSPIFFQGVSVLQDGLLWSAAYFLLFAARPLPIRLCQFFALLAAFTASFSLGRDFVSCTLLGLFCFSWFLALGAVHFAWLGEAHGLPPGWAVRRTWLNAFFASAVGIAAAALALVAWPLGGLHPGRWGRPGHGLRLPQTRPEVASQLKELDMARLAWLGVVTLFAGVLAIIVLVYLRKWLLRRMATRGVFSGAMGQVGELEYTENSPAPVHQPLAGIRGRIVALWARWAFMLERRGFIRFPGESAHAFAERIALEQPDLKPPRELTQIFEAAHYAQPEPTGAELQTMETLVDREIIRCLQNS